MNDITLINVSIAKKFGKKIVYERNSAGIFLLISALKCAGFKVKFSEHFLDHRCSFEEEVARVFSLIDPDCRFIGIGCHSVHLPFVVAVCARLKDRYADKKIILGGIGPSATAADLLKQFGFIDAIAVGEAEETIVEILKQKGDFHSIKGVCYRKNGTVYINDCRMPIEDLDSLAFPAYDALDFKQYEIPTVITSRGCPHGCPFCSISRFWGSKVRYRSIDNIMEELKILCGKYGVKYVFFGDPTFTTDKKRVIELCRRIKSSGLGLRWECLVRVDSMDKELMEDMSEANCEAVFYGLESGSDDVLKNIKQGFTVKEALKVISESQEYFKTVEVSMMWGFPSETLEAFKETLQLRERLENESHCQVQLRWLEPYPDTPLFLKHNKDIFFPDKYSSMYNYESVKERIRSGRDYYSSDEDISGIRIATDVTNARFIIAASHTASMCLNLIKENPHIFCDYYRYNTPDLREKVNLAQKIGLY